jgi:hypothetical protein
MRNPIGNLLIATFLMVTPLLGQETHPKPVAKAEVLSLLSGGVPVGRVTSIVKERGIDFLPDDDYLLEIRRNGGNDELITALRDATTKAQMVDCAQYEQTKGCLVFNEMIRARDESILGVLKDSDETFVMFDPYGKTPLGGSFTLLGYNHIYNKVGIIHNTWVNGQDMGGIVGPEMTWTDCPADNIVCLKAFVDYHDETAEGFREITINSTEIIITIGFSTKNRNVLYSEVFQRSTGRYRRTQFSPSSPGTTFGKAAVYHHLMLQQ